MQQKGPVPVLHLLSLFHAKEKPSIPSPGHTQDLDPRTTIPHNLINLVVGMLFIGIQDSFGGKTKFFSGSPKSFNITPESECAVF